MITQRNRVCGNCEVWCPEYGRRATGACSAKQAGECRRQEPHVGCRWPRTLAEDWCGCWYGDFSITDGCDVIERPKSEFGPNNGKEFVDG